MFSSMAASSESISSMASANCASTLFRFRMATPTLSLIEELTDALDRLKDGYDVMGKAKTEIQKGWVNMASYDNKLANGKALKAIADALDRKAPIDHGNHVPEIEAADNARFLRNDDTWQTVTPTDIGAIPESAKGAAGGVAELDSTGRVPASQLPDGVDDVQEYAAQEIRNAIAFVMTEMAFGCSLSMEMPARRS